jgi:hypothetical protein
VLESPRSPLAGHICHDFVFLGNVSDEGMQQVYNDTRTLDEQCSHMLLSPNERAAPRSRRSVMSPLFPTRMRGPDETPSD